MNPKVSVIIPVYNVEKYLRRCLDSVFDQTLAPEIEVICVDDGSTDGTAAILDEYVSRCSNLIVTHQQNSGSSVARNRALDLATGEYISFVDSDDWYTRPDVLELLYRRAKEFDLDELYFNATGSFETPEIASTKRGVEDLYRFTSPYPQEVLDGKTLFVRLSQSGDFRPYLWRRLYRRAFLDEHRLRFIEGIVHQDFPFTLQCISLARQAGCWDLVAYNRHLRPNSIMTSKDPKKDFYARCICTRQLRAFAQKNFHALNSADFINAYNSRVAILMNNCSRDYWNLTHRERRAFWSQAWQEHRWNDTRVMRVHLIRTLPHRTCIQIKHFLRRIRKGIRKLAGN